MAQTHPIEQTVTRGTRGRRLLVGAGLIAITALAILAGLDALVRHTAPSTLARPTSTLVLDRDGRLLRAFTVGDGRWRLPVTLDEIDPLLIAMLLTIEDHRFFEHPGVDWRAMLRAVGQLATHGRVVSGGSTLTMQLVRLLDGHSTRDARGKLHQILAALALERVADKRAILAAYLQHAPYGGNLEGVRAASLAWFGKEPRRLTPAQAALLVALPQSPEARRPDRDAVAARRARDRVLARATLDGVLTAEQAAAAMLEPVHKQRRAFPMLAAHSARHRVRAAPNRPIHHLTLDARLQARLEALAAEHATRLPDACSVAILVADHANGELLAAVGSAGLLDRQRDGFIDMTRALRSPGSTLKPLIYGLAFEQGLAHPESLIEDRPSGFGGYVPANFDREFQGTVTVRRALQLSLNVPAVAMLETVGPARLLARMRRAGAAPRLPDAAPAGLAVGLGGVGVTLRDLVAVYAAIARGGDAVALVESRDTPPAPVSRQPVLAPRAAWYLADILSGVGAPAGRGGAIALKTGTSYGYRDAWAIGFDGQHVVGVWAGRPDGAAVSGLTGQDAAVPVLRDAFARIGPVAPLAEPPAGVLRSSSGALPPPLRRARVSGAEGNPGDAVAITFPPAGARIDLGLTNGRRDSTLFLKVRNGYPPFVWLADGVPVAREPYARESAWHPTGPGYTTIAVIDARGNASRVSLLLE